MFAKKCPKCNNKIKKQFDYCPHCSFNFKSKHDREDYGFLGKNDFENPTDSFGFGDTFIDRIFNNTVKLLEKQMKNLHNELAEDTKSANPNQSMPNNLRVQFFVNGKNILPQLRQVNPKKQNQRINKITPEKINKISKLPREEPPSKMKRLSGRIIYELEVPGVNNLDDILITPLENSVEIKALSKNKVYSKTLNIKLPILRYGLNRDNLIIEFQGR